MGTVDAWIGFALNLFVRPIKFRCEEYGVEELVRIIENCVANRLVIANS